MTIDLRVKDESAWSDALRPRGEGTPLHKESFFEWWNRNQVALSNLHPAIAEQWVYRHWNNGQYHGLPLQRLKWQLQVWLTANILSEVGWATPESDTQHEHDLQVFRSRGLEGKEPAATMDATGTWNLPPVILSTPQGVLTWGGVFPGARFWLIEGHQRRRYLNALYHHGYLAPQHEVFVLTLTE